VSEHNVKRMWRQRPYQFIITCSCGEWRAAAADQIECARLHDLHVMSEYQSTP
jgi:hypothetical protein